MDTHHRTVTIAARVPRSARPVVELAAQHAGLSLSAYVARATLERVERDFNDMELAMEYACQLVMERAARLDEDER